MSRAGRGRRASLEELRRRLATPRSDRALARLLELLERDPRRGAALLRLRARRELARRRAEARRMSGLLRRRRQLFRQGLQLVAGADEVGMGPLAGPVVAAAVVLPARLQLPGLDDSKRLSRANRERLAEAIRRQALAVAVAEVSVAEIERWNIYRAGLQALRRAVLSLDPHPEHVLVDARRIPELPIPQTPIVGGDACDASIAAASIVAKVHRDALMCELDRRFPGYGFAEHKGYATARHVQALRRRGPSPVHRRSFAPVAQLTLL